MCDNLVDKFNKNTGDSNVENAVQNTYSSLCETYEDYKKVHKYLDNPSRDTKGDLKEWIRYVETIIDSKIDSADEHMQEVKETSDDTLKDFRKVLQDKKAKDMSIDFKATGNESLINSYREMEEDVEQDDQEKSFYLTSQVLTKEWGKN